MEKLKTIDEYLAAGRARQCVVSGWLDFPNYYATDDLRVWSVPRPGAKGKWLTSCPDSHGYFVFGMSNNVPPYQHTIKRGRLMKLIWHGPPENPWPKTEARHGVKGVQCDELDNITWGDAKLNAEDRERDGTNYKGEDVGTSKFSNALIKEIKTRLWTGETRQTVCSDLDFNYRTLAGIAKGHSWKSILPDLDLAVKIFSVFRTIDGEVTLDGPWRWSTFIRFGGCNLRCWKSSGHCDAPASLDMSRDWPTLTIEELVKKAEANFPCRRVTITGGEPMTQPLQACLLSMALRQKGIITSLETSGSICMSKDQIDCFDCVVLDVKPPSTEMVSHNELTSLKNLRGKDYAKFVLSDEDDFTWALTYLEQCDVKAQIAFGPRFGHLDPKELISWIEQTERFDIQLNFQSHKWVWPECEPAPVSDLKTLNIQEFIVKEH